MSHCNVQIPGVGNKGKIGQETSHKEWNGSNWKSRVGKVPSLEEGSAPPSHTKLSPDTSKVELAVGENKTEMCKIEPLSRPPSPTVGISSKIWTKGGGGFAEEVACGIERIITLPSCKYNHNKCRGAIGLVGTHQSRHDF